MSLGALFSEQLQLPTTAEPCRPPLSAVQPASYVPTASVLRVESQQFHLWTAIGRVLTTPAAQHEVSIRAFRLESVLATCCPRATRRLFRFCKSIGGLDRTAATQCCKTGTAQSQGLQRGSMLVIHLTVRRHAVCRVNSCLKWRCYTGNARLTYSSLCAPADGRWLIACN